MIHSTVTGNGLPIVFIHGYGEDLSLWQDISTTLSKEYKFIALDLPGFGRSAALEGPFSLESIAEIVHQHITVQLNIKEYFVFGHSLGGYISLALVNMFPHAILGFGLINSTSLADNDDKKATRLKAVDFINKHGAQFFLTSFVPNLFTSKNQTQLQDKVDIVMGMGKNLDKNVLTNYMLAMRERPNNSELLKKHENVLFIGGKEDSHFSKEDYSYQLNLLQHPQYGHILSNTAHMSMYEDQNRLIYCILGFLRSVKKTEIKVD